jgi:catechol 2,3-dioxygenase-like lactoylglutathione lyase family enzyme
MTDDPGHKGRGFFPEAAMRAGAVLETVIYATDIAAAQRFYGDVLGLDLHLSEDGHFAFFRCGAQMLLIFHPDYAGRPDGHLPHHGTRGPGHLCFRADTPEELDLWRARLTAEGVAIEQEELWPRGGRSFYFRDPAGNSLEFAEPRIWGM